MERKTFSMVQIYVRDNYNRAGKLFAVGEIDEAIGVLVSVVRKNPELPVLYERLREYELAKCRNQNPLAKIFWMLFSIVPFILISVVKAVNPIRALAMCEGPLAHCVDNVMVLNTLAAAAERCEAPWIAATALNVIRVLHPGNTANQKALVKAMQDNGQAREALKIQQQLVKGSSHSLEMQNELREAMALASIERGRFEEKGEKKKAVSKDAVLLQVLEGTIHDAEQAQLIIDRFTEDLKTNDSIDMRRKLADAYMVAERYEDALNEYRTVAEKLGVPDPMLDKQIEKAYVANLNASIKTLQDDPSSYENPEQQIAELRQERDSYKLRHAVERVRTFPNDMQLQFDLAELRFERNELAEAKEMFTAILQNPQKRRPSLVYLGRCELLGGNPKLAREHIGNALKEMYTMDRAKREALYFFAQACEADGDRETALTTYRQIAANIASYRDVNERIAALTGNAPAAAGTAAN